MADIIFQRTENDTSPDAWGKLAAMQRAAKAREIFARNLSQGDKVDANGKRIAAGNIDETGFYRGMAKAGLGAEDAKTAMDWNAAGKSADIATALADTQLRNYGQDPMAGGRNGATVGEPAPVEVPNPDYQAAPAKPTLEDWWTSMGGKTAPVAPSDADQIQAQTAAPSGAGQAQDPVTSADMGRMGSASLATSQLQPLPEGAGASPTVLRPGQDARSARQLVEDSYDPTQTLAARTDAKTQASAPDASMFEWKATDNGSNQFQQFQQALGAKLKGIGAVDASGAPDPAKYLQQVYSSTVMSNMPPAPNTALMNQGLEGLTKYEGEVQAYAAGIAKAKGLGQAAVLKAKSDLIDYAGKFGVDTLESEKFGWTKGARVSIEDQGFDPNRVNAEQAVDLTGRKNMLIGLGDMIASSKDDLMGKNGAYAQRAAVVPIMTSLAKIEDVGTEAGQNRLTLLASFSPSLEKAVQEGGLKALPDAVVQLFATNPQEGYAALSKMVELTKKDGILAGQLKAAGAKDPFGVGGEKAPQKLTAAKLGAALGAKPKAGAYKATKTNAAGMKMGQKPDGTWEPMR